ncbi:phage terminase large subunit [Herbaspirillum sp. AP02]|uniref:phage terminase large subunit n=1 Tax=unclassified Herbaspirillum TaxID=2624150 RepID=UPI0015DB34E3|nr:MULTISPECIES: phage terminase large subunit [unclassified Herbaspirillum]MBG7619354.1 phage terminase large subunit [Herbaspirillum sp. AP02]NZD66638.1 phage terminase large subunit [Herbaspirillum sp. AP21]
MDNKPISFLAFFLLWAKVMKWKVPTLHVRVCHWLEFTDDPVRVLQVFRGAAKSSIFAVYKAWQLYCDRTWVSLIWAADGKLATKLTRDTINVLRRHPLCGGMLPTKPGAQMFWVKDSEDARNASMTATGVNQNVTSARAKSIDYDDVEVPKNIKTAEARENLRDKIQEATFILVPGGQETYIGTPHTHSSIYPELIENGAASLKIPLFESAIRYEDTGSRLRYRFPFKPGDDGLYVFVGIHKHARLLVQDQDFTIDGQDIVFTRPPGKLLDIYAHCAWPERFTRDDVERRRKKTRTINYWDSQYMLEAKPINESRLDPEAIKAYDVQPRLEYANRAVRMMLGKTHVVSGRAYWDPSLGKKKSDASAFSVVYDDSLGNHYWHVCQELTGDFAVFNDSRNTVIESGQVLQACDIIAKANILHVYVETNGVGSFAGKLLQRALKQRGLAAGVTEIQEGTNKNERILGALEGPIKSGVLWAHIDVLNGPLWDQMKDWKPEVKEQPDDFLDSGAGAVEQAPVRINKLVGKPTPDRREDWRQSTGVYEVTLDS